VASALLAGFALLLLFFSAHLTSGMLSRHMLVHIALMSLLAPAVALQLWQPLRRRGARFPLMLLLGAAALQIVVFAAWHSPPGLAAGMATRFSGAVMQFSLLMVATLFWLAVLLGPGCNRWGAVFALLVTGKVFCLIGALMVFAPRLLFGHDFAPIDPAAGVRLANELADQQLAGLLMLTACPLTYVLVSVAIVCGWLFHANPTQSAPILSLAAKS
jgi:putative membrane protein